MLEDACHVPSDLAVKSLLVELSASRQSSVV